MRLKYLVYGNSYKCHFEQEEGRALIKEKHWEEVRIMRKKE